MKYIFSVLFLSASLIACGQPVDYVDFKRITDSIFDKPSTEAPCKTAIQLEAIYIDTNNQFPDGYFELALSKFLCGDRKESIRWLQRSMECQGLEKELYERFSTDEMMEYHQWKDVIEHYDEYYSVFESKLDLPLKLIIDSLMEVDQSVRNREYGSEEELYQALRVPDSTNWGMLKKLIDKYGIPNRYVIGNESSFSFLVMLFHYIHPDLNIADWTKYSNMVREDYVEKGGFVYRDWILFFIDEGYSTSSYYNKHQYYGTMGNKETNQIRPIIDVAEVDKRRYAIGVGSLEQYAKKNGFALPEGYILSD